MSVAGAYLAACGIRTADKKPIPPADSVISTAQPPVKQPSVPLTVYKKGDPQYDVLRKGFNKRIDKYPLAIAVCHTAEEVSAAILYAKENKLPVTVKSGGHCMEGFSCNDNGLVINLSSHNKIQWLSDHKIKVGPGCTLSMLYDELLPKKKIIPSGSCGGVGLGGLTLGGGYGLFSRQMGLTCDSLEEVTMVDGNGGIRTSDTDSELLWACRGGGSGGYGVVTDMVFRVHDAPRMLTAHWFRVNVTNPERGAAVLEKWFQLTSDMPLSCFSAFVLNGKLLNILLTNTETHSADVQHMIDAMSPLVDKVTVGKPRPLAIAVRNYFGLKGPVYFKNASAGLYKSFDDIKLCIKEVIEKVNNTPGMIYQLNTMGGNIDLAASRELSAYPHRSLHYVSELQTYWDVPGQEERLLRAFSQVQDIFQKNGVKAQYRNYPDINFTEWANAYYGENYERLQRIKTKYDPDNVIQGPQSIKVKAKV